MTTKTDRCMEEKPKTAMSRREFARRAAMASAAATASAVTPLATVRTVDASATPASVNAPPPGLTSAPGPAAEPSAPPQPQQSAGMPKLSPESQAEVDSRIQAILSRYGSRFSEEQKADIRRLCAVAQPPLDRLRAYALENGDNPALYLKPLVEREKKPAGAQAATSVRRAPTSAAAPLGSSSTAKTPGASAQASPSTAKASAPGAAKAPPAGAAKKP
jgi:hypothetical protein